MAKDIWQSVENPDEYFGDNSDLQNLNKAKGGTLLIENNQAIDIFEPGEPLVMSSIVGNKLVTNPKVKKIKCLDENGNEKIVKIKVVESFSNENEVEPISHPDAKMGIGSGGKFMRDLEPYEDSEFEKKCFGSPPEETPMGIPKVVLKED